MPGTRSLAGPYVVCALLGATSFSLLPVALELLSILTLPVSPEVASVIAWTGGQILGAIFILIMDALQSPNGWDGEPKNTMKRSLVFQAVIFRLILAFILRFFLPNLLDYLWKSGHSRRYDINVELFAFRQIQTTRQFEDKNVGRPEPTDLWEAIPFLLE